MVDTERKTPFEYGEILTLSRGNKLVLTGPSPWQGRGNNGRMNYFTLGGYYG
jgi:hypothetical protein